MRFLTPKSRGGMVWRMLLAVVIFVGCGAGVTATAGLLQVKTLVSAISVNLPIKSKGITLPAAGKPQTLLLIGSDHRAHTAVTDARTDTMLLVRLDASSSTINMLSIPRDLQVDVPGYGIEKLNAAYSQGGYNLLLKTIHSQVFPKLKINHVVNTNFDGFSDMIDALGCVYSDVDHRYYNVSSEGIDNYSSIDIQPGYQKLCGDNQSIHGALPFVRFRHTDTDILRAARQQDFIRWAKDQFSTGQLISDREKLFKIFGKHSTLDQSLHTSVGVIELFDLILNSDASSIKQIVFPALYANEDGVDYVTAQTAAEEQTYARFMAPTKAAKTTKKPPSGARTRKHTRHRTKLDTMGLEGDATDGRDQAAALTHPGMPVYYPTLIVAPTENGDLDWDPAYCLSTTGTCDGDDEPSSAYETSYPRQYLIPLKGSKEKVHAYRMTVQLNGTTDQYYGIQGVAWNDPPLLNNPSATKTVDGRKLSLYSAGGKLTTVAWHKGKWSYWISNDLTSDIPNHEMVALAASMVRYRAS